MLAVAVWYGGGYCMQPASCMQALPLCSRQCHRGDKRAQTSMPLWQPTSRKVLGKGHGEPGTDRLDQPVRPPVLAAKQQAVRAIHTTLAAGEHCAPTASFSAQLSSQRGCACQSGGGDEPVSPTDHFILLRLAQSAVRVPPVRSLHTIESRERGGSEDRQCCRALQCGSPMLPVQYASFPPVSRRCAWCRKRGGTSGLR